MINIWLYIFSTNCIDILVNWLTGTMIKKFNNDLDYYYIDYEAFYNCLTFPETNRHILLAVFSIIHALTKQDNIFVVDASKNTTVNCLVWNNDKQTYDVFGV